MLHAYMNELTLEVRDEFTHETPEDEVTQQLADEGKRHTEDAQKQVGYGL